MLTVFMHIDDLYLVPLMVVVKTTPIPDGYLVPRKEHVESKILNFVIVRKREDKWQNVLNGQTLKTTGIFKGDLWICSKYMKSIKSDFEKSKHVTNDDLVNYLDQQNEMLFKALDEKNKPFNNFINDYIDAKNEELFKKLEDAIGKENLMKALEIINIEKIKVRKKEK